MNYNFYRTFLNTKAKKFAILIDPDKQNDNLLIDTLNHANKSPVDFIFLGGSLVSDSVDYLVQKIKHNTSIPVVLFPGSLLQLSNRADGILLLSLISGRNPDYLIGNHVLAAPFLKKSKLEVIPTGYILIESDGKSSVEYISNTKPIPSNKPELVVATAIAGEMLGYKLIYLEAGSGATNTIDTSIIQNVKENISVPLIVGGGIKSKKDIQNIYNSGADIVVVGSAIEKEPSLISNLSEVSHNFNTKTF